MKSRASIFACSLPFLAVCGGGGSDGADAGPTCDFPLDFAVGTDGHADPLGAGPTEARAGRINAAQLPPTSLNLVTWKGGDFVLANDKIALVIEDVGASDLYDPWGGRPVGLARVENHELVDPMNFGEFFVLTGRESVVTQHVSVINDGSNGEPAVIRASGPLAPLPFFEAIVGGLFRDEYPDVPSAIEYSLAPGAEHVDITMVYHSPHLHTDEVHVILHGYLYTDRNPIYAPDLGFDTTSKDLPYAGFIDESATSYAYSVPGETLGSGVSASGFVSHFSPGFTMAACGETRHLHARLTIGGPGLDGLVQAVARDQGDTLRAISGTVTDAAGQPAAGVSVHAERAGGEGKYLTRAHTDAAGHFTLHVPAGQAVDLTAFRRGDSVVGPIAVAADATAQDLQLAPEGLIHVTVKDFDSAVSLPARVQLLPTAGSPPDVPGRFGEPGVTGGRLSVDFTTNGDLTLRAPAGAWRLVVSRGYEYELADQVVQVTAGQTLLVPTTLEHVVDTTGQMCADFHIHTIRSADSGDDIPQKVRSAAADGLEIPVRSDHEYVDTFQPTIEQLGLSDWAFGIASIEMTSMEIWGHMGVFPLEPDPTKPNNGAPIWQEYPTAEHPEIPLRTMRPPEVFDAVRARPEQPIVIINHPLGSTNYFGYVGYDPVTGMVDSPEDWDETFNVVEFFNDSGWQENRNGRVAYWLSFLDHGRRVFAVGSSDSHGITSSPVGYPRTCLSVGTDDPHQLTPNLVRDTTAAGHSFVTGGIYVSARIGAVGPGDDATGLGPTANVHVRVQAASWIDVDAIDLVVDGQTVDTIPITPADADPANPTVRFEQDLPIDVSQTGNGYVIVAAYGDATLEPVHPGRLPFGVTNPIFVSR